MPGHETDAKPFEVVIAGGGVGALEAVLALHTLAGARVKVTLVAPTDVFSYRPMAVLEPFVRRPPRELDLARLAAELDVDFLADTIVAVDSERAVLQTGDQRELPYDALLIAIGARTGEPLPNTVTVDVSSTAASLSSLIDDLDAGAVHSVAFVAPKPTWPLPAYELALLVREHARENSLDVALTIVTAEPGPLAVFGDAVSAAVETLLLDAEITTVLSAEVTAPSGELVVHPGGGPLARDRVVALPRLRGPAISGLPSDAGGFLPVTSFGEVVGARSVYAAGDATNFPVKYGAIAAQQADAAASMIAAAAGAPIAPMPFDGIVHGFLLSGRNVPRLHFSARIEGATAHDSQIIDAPERGLQAKIAARYLGPYLDELWAAGARWLSGPWSGSEAVGGGDGRR